MEKTLLSVQVWGLYLAELSGGFFFSIIAIKSGNFLVCLDLKVSSSNSCHVWMELHGHKEIENDCPAHGLLSIFFCLGHLHSNLWFQSLRPL